MKEKEEKIKADIVERKKIRTPGKGVKSKRKRRGERKKRRQESQEKEGKIHMSDRGRKEERKEANDIR